MNRALDHFLFAFAVSGICLVLYLILPVMGSPAMTVFFGVLNIAPFYGWLFLEKVPYLGGLWSYVFLIFLQWFVVGLAVSFLFRRKGQKG